MKKQKKKHEAKQKRQKFEEEFWARLLQEPTCLYRQGFKCDRFCLYYQDCFPGAE